MSKLNKISSTALLTYLIIIVAVTASEYSEISSNQWIYVSSRIVCFLLALPCYYLFRKDALSPTPQILMSLSLLIYNIGGYYFRPLYLYSFMHSIYALSFFVFMSRMLFLFAKLWPFFRPSFTFNILITN